MRNVTKVMATLIAWSLPGTASYAADQEACQAAVTSYKAAVDDVQYGLKRYIDCVGSSQGRDDCSSEFHRLKSAQDDFETAVSGYRSDCSD
jgi:hypothetical protein